jgi:hypothetical protein
LPDRAHQLGCPAKRIERYEVDKPIRVAGMVTGHEKVLCVRCCDCAGEILIPVAEVPEPTEDDAEEVPNGD